MTRYSVQFIEWSKKRAERIRKEVPIAQVLYNYGYRVHADLSEVHEQQFSCDMHGDGTDNKPSARVYPATQSWYCWGCGQSRDAISTVRDKEGLRFHQACAFLERKFGMEPMPVPKDFGDPDKIELSDFSREKRTVTFNSEAYRLARLIEIQSQERTMTMKVILGFWEAFDCICWRVRRKHWKEESGLLGLSRLKHKLNLKVLEYYAQDEEDETDYNW